MALAIDITNGRGLSNEARRLATFEEEQGSAVFAVHFTVTSCALLTRWSASVLKVGALCASRSLQTDWPVVLQLEFQRNTTLYYF